MELNQYSEILSIMTLSLIFIVIIHLIFYLFSKKVNSYTKNVDYFLYLKMIGIIAITSTVGVLIYQFIYNTPVCEYCWWQRIFMFPIDIIILTSIICKIKKNEIITLILSFIGLVFASVHYWYHYQNVVLGNEVSSGCSIIGIVPSCTNTSVVVWGFFTIPLMATFAFTTIIWLSYLAYKSNNK